MTTTIPATTTTLESALCGDANDDGEVSATDALKALRGAVGTGDCDLELCDFSGDGELAASDALGILRLSVGQPVVGNCPSAAASGASTTLPVSTTVP